MRISLGCLIALGCISSASAAGTAPRAIWGKSFVVAVTEERRQRVLPDGAWRDVAVSRTTQLYVSSAGRVFKRDRVVVLSGGLGGPGAGSMRRGSGQSGALDRVVGENNPRLDVSFQGNTILATSLALRGGGARRLTIQVDEAGQSCQASVVLGKSGGGTYVLRNIINKSDLEIESARNGDASCSVVNGNVFE